MLLPNTSKIADPSQLCGQPNGWQFKAEAVVSLWPHSVSTQITVTTRWLLQNQLEEAIFFSELQCTTEGQMSEPNLQKTPGASR